VQQDPDLATAHSALGLVYERLGDEGGAEQHYRRAVELEPGDPDTINSLAVYLCLQKAQTTEALAYFDQALAIPLSTKYANKAMLHTNAGVCAKRVDLDRAENYFRQALSRDPRYSAALLQLADVSFQRDNYLQARAFLERYLAVAPALPAALWLGVRIERGLGDERAAQDYGRQLKADFPLSEETGLLLEQERDAG
jgi:type IV pilus assembly protein PilF